MARKSYKAKTYKAVCPYCGKDIWIAKCLFMHMGYNNGFGKCPHCDKNMEIEFNEKEQTMNTAKREEIN